MDLGTAIVGLTAMLAGTSTATLVAQVAEAPGSVVTITSAGATVSAVSALIYVVKQMVSGQLVARSSAATDEALAKMVELYAEATRREDRFIEFISSGRISGGQ